MNLIQNYKYEITSLIALITVLVLRANGVL